MGGKGAGRRVRRVDGRADLVPVLGPLDRGALGLCELDDALDELRLLELLRALAVLGVGREGAGNGADRGGENKVSRVSFIADGSSCCRFYQLIG